MKAENKQIETYFTNQTKTSKIAWKPNSPQQHQDPSNRCQKTRTRPKRAHERTDPKFKKEYRALVVSRPCGSFLTVLARNAETLRSWDGNFLNYPKRGEATGKRCLENAEKTPGKCLTRIVSLPRWHFTGFFQAFFAELMPRRQNTGDSSAFFCRENAETAKFRRKCSFRV